MIPQFANQKDSPILLIDLGNLSVKSDLKNTREKEPGIRSVYDLLLGLNLNFAERFLIFMMTIIFKSTR